MPLPYNKQRKEASDIIFPAEGQKWGGMNRYDQFSRWNIQDTEWDDLQNWLPQDNSYRQMPAQSVAIATLLSPVIWMKALPLANSTFLFCLCTNTHVYQVSTSGVITDVGTGFSSSSDITTWQGSTIILSDITQNKVFSWNGSVLTTVFTAQPARFVAVFGGRLWMAFNQVIVFTNAG